MSRASQFAEVLGLPFARMVRPATVILPAALLTCILALWAFQAAPVPNEAPSDDSCSIEGRAVNSVTGAAVARATLTLGRTGGRPGPTHCGRR